MPAKRRRSARRAPRPASHDRLIVELSRGALWLTLNRPDKRNAIDAAMIEALHEALERADLDQEVRVVAVCGAGRDFCAGADLAELLASADQSMSENEAGAMRLGGVFLRMRRLPKPVVAVVRGRALAGGCGLATACDVVLAHEQATFGYPEVSRGFVPAMVMAMLRRVTTEKTAFDLIATGRLLTAAEAHAAGLVSRVLPSTTFDTDARAVLAQLVESSASAVALTKRQLYEIDRLAFDEAVALGARVNAVARTTPDFRAAVAQFLRR